MKKMKISDGALFLLFLTVAVVGLVVIAAIY
jgi:hypothetical protein